MTKPAALAALLVAGCGGALAPAPAVIEIAEPVPAAAPAPPVIDVPFTGTYPRYAIVSYQNGAPHPIDNASGTSTLRVEVGRVVFEQVYPKGGTTRHITQVYSFDPEGVRRSPGDVYDVPLVFRSIESDSPGYAPDRQKPWLTARKRAWGWDIALMAVDTTDVLAAASFGAAPPGTPPPDLAAYAKRVGARLPERASAGADGAIPAPLDVKAPPPNASVTGSGLAYRFLQRGQGGRMPTAQDSVVVHYTGWTTDGKMFDSSVVRGSPATFPLRAVIAGWTEGLQLMREGDTARFWMPANLAYGNNPRAGAPQGMLVFDVELIAVK